MNNIKFLILKNLFEKYTQGKFNDLRFLVLIAEVLLNYKEK